MLKEEIVSNSKGASILIDNFFVNKSKNSIIISSYIDKVDLGYFEENIFSENNLQLTKKKYKDYINKLNE